MGRPEFQIERIQRDHVDDHEVSSIGPCSLLQEVHDERRDMQVRSRKGDRVSMSNKSSREQVRIVGAVKVFDSKDEEIIVDHAYNKKIHVEGREIVEQHHDRERREHRHDSVLFGLISGDHKERNIRRDVCIDGKVNQYAENSRDHTVKFLGITIAHSHHMDNGNNPPNPPKPRRISPPLRAGKGW